MFRKMRRFKQQISEAEFKYFKIHVSVLLSFYVVMIAKGGFFELDKIAVGGNASQWINDGKLNSHLSG